MNYSDKKTLLSAAIQAVDFLTETAEESIISSSATAPRLESQEHLPDNGMAAIQVIDLLSHHEERNPRVIDNGLYFGSARHKPQIAPLAASWVAVASGQRTGHKDTPTLSAIEIMAESWLIDVLPVFKESSVLFVENMVMANFHALTIARSFILDSLEWDADKKGLIGSPPIKIVIGEDASSEIFKSIVMLGFGDDNVVRVPTDRNGCIRIDKVPPLHSRTILCLQAGNEDSGGMDSGQLISMGKKYGAWVHIDGRSGLWAGASARKRHLTKWYEYADSWTTSTSRWLGTPSDAGIFITRHIDLLRKSLDGNERNWDEIKFLTTNHRQSNPSTRIRAAEIWAAMQTLGKSGIDERISNLCLYAELFGHRLEHAGFEVLNEIEMNHVLISFGSDEETIKIITAVQESGMCWVDQTIWKGRAAMRVTVSSERTTESGVSRSCIGIIKTAFEILRAAA